MLWQPQLSPACWTSGQTAANWAGRGQAPHLPVSLPHGGLWAWSVWRDVEPRQPREEQGTARRPPSPQARAHTWPGPPTHLPDSES